MQGPKRWGAVLLAGALLAGCTSTDTTWGEPRVRSVAPSTNGSAAVTSQPKAPQVSRDERRLVDHFVAFALDPGTSTIEALPLSPRGVSLGLGEDLVKDLAQGEEGNPASWRIGTDTGFRGYVGPFSALRAVREHVQGREGDSGLRNSGDIAISVGPHPHCAGPPIPAPSGLAEMRRVSLQPADDSITSCLAWFTVDLFLDSNRDIVAVSLDVWEP